MKTKSRSLYNCDKCRTKKEPRAMGRRPSGWERVGLKIRGVKTTWFDMCDKCLGASVATKNQESYKLAVWKSLLDKHGQMRKTLSRSTWDVISKFSKGVVRLVVKTRNSIQARKSLAIPENIK